MKKKYTYSSFYLSIFFLSILLTSCGYRLVGTASTLPPHIKTVAIPLFSNSSREPAMENQVTGMIRSEFIKDGRLNVVDGNNADMTVSGNISKYALTPISFDSTDNASQYWVEITVDVEATDNKNNVPILKKSIKTKWDYTASTNLLTSESERRKAVSEASQDLALKLISLIIEGF